MDDLRGSWLNDLKLRLMLLPVGLPISLVRQVHLFSSTFWAKIRSGLG